MLNLPEAKQIYVYPKPVDMRKSINGLSAILIEAFDRKPSSGDLYVFINRQKNKVKCLLWDVNGFVLHYKRLEQGRFNYSRLITCDELMIAEEQLSGLLRGIDFYLQGGFSLLAPKEFY